MVAALVIFGAGFVTGTLSHKLVPAQTRPLRLGLNGPTTPWTAPRRMFLRRMERELDLAPAQREHIQQIMDASQERMKKLWEPVAPGARDEFHRLREQIRAELTPPQRAKFDEMFKKRPHKPEGASPKKGLQDPATSQPPAGPQS
ncbi:MAG: Spy/CpxP family protein refolding chaperone [Limisphaerales bacterium]